jgi:hypothetical protein
MFERLESCPKSPDLPGKCASAVRLLWHHEEEDPSRWAAVKSIAGKVGCLAEAPRKHEAKHC